jgi:glycogen operon protein
MMAAGDEMGRTQRGNNNAYCQDNEISWVSWELSPEQQALLDFVSNLLRLRREHPVLRRRRFLHGRRSEHAEAKDLVWLRADGAEMTSQDWQSGHTRCLAMRLAGDAIEEADERGRRIVDDSFLLMLNANDHNVRFTVSRVVPAPRWVCVIDTGTPARVGRTFAGGARYVLQARSLALFVMRRARG